MYEALRSSGLDAFPDANFASTKEKSEGYIVMLEHTSPYVATYAPHTIPSVAVCGARALEQPRVSEALSC